MRKRFNRFGIVLLGSEMFGVGMRKYFALLLENIVRLHEKALSGYANKFRITTRKHISNYAEKHCVFTQIQFTRVGNRFTLLYENPLHDYAERLYAVRGLFT